MCGIYGILARSGHLDRVAAASSMQKKPFVEDLFQMIRRRGPDYQRLDWHQMEGLDCAIGHSRLSIQDLSNHGHQPMDSDCGRYTISYNGEIYNAPVLKAELIAKGRVFQTNTDTEVIVNGYAQWGEAILEKITGMFAFVIFDHKTQSIFAARDRVGIKPFYFAARDDLFVFSSNAHAVAKTLGDESLSVEGTALYLMLGFAPSPYTLFSAVHKLEGGMCLTWSLEKGLSVKTYWAAPTDTDFDGVSAKEVDELLHGVVEDHLLSDVPISYFLSGGLDSSAVAYWASQGDRGASSGATAFTLDLGIRGRDDEAAAAKQTADLLGVRNEQVVFSAQVAQDKFNTTLSAFDDLVGNDAIVTQFTICEAAARAYKVVLSGDGGDEILGGYPWHDKAFQLNNPAGKTANWLRSRLRLTGRDPQKKAVLARARFGAKSDLHAHIAWVYRNLLPADLSALGVSEADAEALLVAVFERQDAPRLQARHRLQRIDLRTFCMDYILTKVDRTSMHFGLEVRPPLLDHRLVDAMLSRPVPSEDRYPLKKPLYQAMRTGGFDHLLDRPKLGFGARGARPFTPEQSRNIVRGKGDLASEVLKGLERNGTMHSSKSHTLHFLSAWSGIHNVSLAV